jgi:two-component system KDP operon response regulator KdpE
LVSDSDPQIRRVLQTILVREGFEITSTANRDVAVDLIRAERFDLVLLDLDMPLRSAIRTCREIRSRSDIGIILLATSASEKDKVDALLAGADDYVTKPFNTPELLARIRAILRRGPFLSSNDQSLIRSDELEIDFHRRRVKLGNREERLTPKEFDVLRYLAARANKTVDRQDLLQEIWGSDCGSREQCLRGCVSRLRRKIETCPDEPKYLLTIPWVGYRLNLPE